jgi:fructose-1,6-bisphosphatase/inositol monophosphatase family enzyme
VVVTSELDFAKSLAAEAGAIMREHFRTGVPYRDKGDGTPVTLADEAINDLVLERVAAQYPGDGVIGEERSRSAADSSGRVWVCDPIDGTLPFTLGVPTNLFSLALVEDGVPTVGVLYDPYLDRMYEAALGQGASVNGVPLRVSETPLGEAILALPGAQFGLTDNAALASDVIARGMRIFSVSSVTYDGALVAAGQIAACVFPATSVWDIAALKVLVEEAGGLVTDIDGNSQRYDQPIRGALMSNKRAHDDLVELVRPHLFDTPRADQLADYRKP